MTTGADGRDRCMHEREGAVVACAGTESETLGRKDGHPRMNSEFRGGVGPQVMQSNGQIDLSAKPNKNPPPPARWLFGDRRNNHFHASLRCWLVAAGPSFSLLCLFSFCLSAPYAWYTCPPTLWPSSGTVCSLARFQVNQKQIQGRAQPNFGPPWKPWPGPHFICPGMADP